MTKGAPKKKPPKRGTNLIITIGLCLTVTILSVVISQYNLSIIYGHDPVESSEADSRTIEEKLDSATRPFEGKDFPMEQIFGDEPIWGSLNSGHYFGLKLSSPQSIEAGLVWFENHLNSNGGLNIRHLCDQNDRLNYYAWLRHDFNTFGEHIIHDRGYKIRSTYLKTSTESHSWQARFEISMLESNVITRPLSIIKYLTIPQPREKLVILSPSTAHQNSEEPFRVQGRADDVGQFVWTVKINSGKNLLHDSYLTSHFNINTFPLDKHILNNLLPVAHNQSQLFVFPAGRKLGYRGDPLKGNSNFVAYQMIFNGPAEFTVSFESIDDIASIEDNLGDYNGKLAEKISKFDLDFDKTFPLDSTILRNVSLEEAQRLAKVSLSNMLGSVGYFHGVAFVGSNSHQSKIAHYGPIQLLTAVPSRSFFPRGFLWDEGFHNLLISRWDVDLSNKIIKSWFNIMNEEGWIPREVILGLESMRRVPREFIVQRIENANPPAMFIVIDQLLDQGNLHDSTLDSVYPRLKAWYKWFNSTQSGPQRSTFRWRGRDELSVSMLNPKTLTSGLDDYPRASHPSPSEYHIDLRCWMAFASRALSELAAKKGDSKFRAEMELEAAQLANNQLLDELHWSDEHQMYCDFGHNTEKAELIYVTKTRPSKDGHPPETYRVLERHSTGNPKFTCVPEFGYVSLFPMMLRILDPRSEKLGVLLDRLRDENELWSPYGIRSLSRLSRYYNKYNTEHDKPYWRGAIWLNMNYLILSSLKSYSTRDGPYKERCAKLFIELKENLVNNVVKEFSKTNYIWENFDDQTGQGRGSHPFTGWSSLILLIMSSNLD